MLEEESGSSPYVIANKSSLPANFRKMLIVEIGQ